MVYTRPTHTDPAADGSPTDATVILDALSDGLEAVEAALPGKVNTGDAPTAHKTSHATGGADALTAADVGAAPSTQTINAQTGTTYTIAAGDTDKIVTLSNTGAITVTCPQDSDVTFAVGRRVDFVVINTGMVTFAAGTGATVNGTPSLVSRARWSAVSLIKRAANVWVAVGDLAT